MEEWNRLFPRYGLKINLEKTEVLHIGHQREELDIELERKKLTEDGEKYVEEHRPERKRGEQLRG